MTDTAETVRLYRTLGERGLIVGSSGNVSARVPEGMVITPSGGSPETLAGGLPDTLAGGLPDTLQAGNSADTLQAGNSPDTLQAGNSPDTLQADGLALVTLEGVALNAATPSSEWAMHAAIYQADAAARVIVHTHADACTALACLGESLPAFHYMVLQFGGPDVRCAPYATFGTPALAALAVTALHERTACLLGNHGMIVVGGSHVQALAHALLLEQLCRQYLLARAAGTPRLLSAAEMDAARQRFRTYGPRSAAGGSSHA